MRRKLQQIMLAAMIPAALALVPAAADAQRGGHPGGGRPPGGHPGGHPGGGTVVVRGGYYGYPSWGLGWGWGPYWNSYWYGPYWGYPYPYGGYGYYDNGAQLRLEVKPKQAKVYVDGYYAGIVDDFDGTFDRLYLRPGNHELVLFLEGYRTVRQTIRLAQHQDARIKYQMVALAAGETPEPPPQPPAAPPGEPNAGYPPAQRRQPARPAEPRPVQPVVEPGAAGQAQGFGSLVIRVQPSGADVIIDGERWQGPEGSERLVVQVSAGSHKVEVRKEGTVPFSTTIGVRPGETVPLNVSLPPKGD
jgi:hypothetical protein